MKRFFVALVCAAMVWLMPSFAMANSDVYSCDAFARYTAKDGTTAVVRQQWSNIIWTLGPVQIHENRYYEVVFVSGDPLLDKIFRSPTPMHRVAAVSQAQVLATLEKYVPKAISLVAARTPNYASGPSETQAKCWRNGTVPPDRRGWPAATQTPSSGMTCRGAVYFRIRDGADLSERYEKVLERSGLSGPVTAAETELRRALVEHARSKANALTGDADNAVLDTLGGAAEATPIRCWSGSKPGAPADWRGPTTW